MLDGMSKVSEMVAVAKQQGSPAIAITDHGAMHGVVDFSRAAKKAGIKPLIGMEAYLTLYGKSHKSKTAADKSSYHLLLLAKNDIGYQNLMQIATISQLEGFYYKPRIDHAVLEQYGDGLIVTSGCLGSEIPSLILQSKEEDARNMVEWYLQRFKDDFYFELQDHNQPDFGKVNSQLIAWGKEFGIPLVATNDAHYAKKEQAVPHDVMLCIQTGSTVDKVDRMRFNDDSYYIKSAEEMSALFPEEAIANTIAIANKCTFSLKTGGEFHLPVYSSGLVSNMELLERAVRAGLKERYAERPPLILEEKWKTLSKDVLDERIKYEMSIIEKMGFEAYFLIVYDILKFARENGIWYNVRGSAAGSLVAYCLKITDVEPITNELYFERFLNPDRVSMPDIDMDFADDQRHLVVEYTVNKYGEDKVAQIVTFGTMAVKASFKDCARAMKLPLPIATKFTEAIPLKAESLDDAYNKSETLRDMCADKDVKAVFEMAKQLEGRVRNSSTHAAGIVISDKPLVKYAPLGRITGTPITESLSHTVQYEMGNLEEIGLIKMDYLGLKTISLMRKVCELIKKRHGIDFNLLNIPIHDKSIYQLLSSGNTGGCFQVEGDGMANLLVKMKPEKYEHVMAAISLFRPGPMQYVDAYIDFMHGVKSPTYKLEAVRPALEETYSIIVYQEQVMAIARALSGYTMGEADTIRKAIGKKNAEALLAHKEKFVSGGVERGHPQNAMEQIWSDIEYFARYSFPKAHGADYAKLTCQTAFLKANYPLEFISCFLTKETADTKDFAKAFSDCKKQGIKFLPLDINESEHPFTVEGDAIRIGFCAVKGMTVPEFVGRPYKTMNDVVKNSGLKSKKEFEILGWAGAFDQLESRAKVVNGIDSIIAYKKNEKKNAGMASMFEDEGVYFADASMTDQEIAEKELEAFGFYINGNPFYDKLSSFEITHTVQELEESKPAKAVIAGVIKTFKPWNTKTGKEMAFVNVEDKTGTVDLVVFPEQFVKHKDLLVVGAMITCTGKVDCTKQRPQIIVDHISKESYKLAKQVKEEEMQQEPTRFITVYIEDTTAQNLESFVSKMKKLSAIHKGDYALRLFYNRNIIDFPKIRFSNAVMPIIFETMGREL